jgi:hypothetical protein
MILNKADIKEWFDAASVNVTVATLFVFAPLFGIPVRFPGYVAALKLFYEKKLTSRTGFFIGSQLLTQLLGVFINVGSIPVVYHLASVNSRFATVSILSNALNRGFGGAIFWSPYFAAMALVTTALHISWTTILPYALGLSLLSVAVSLIVELPSLRSNTERMDVIDELPSSVPAQPERSEVAPSSLLRALWSLGFYLVLAITTVIVLEQALGQPIVLITCMVAVLYPLLWCLLTGAMATYRQGIKAHVTLTIPSLKKEITLFLAAGFFSGAIGGTSFGLWVPKLLTMVPLPIPFTLVVSAVILITGTSLVGLHPIVLVTIFATGIDPASLGISPLFLALLLLGSWGISNPVSPASAVNNLLSGLLKKDVFELAAGNYKFVAVMVILIPAYLLILRL